MTNVAVTWRQPESSSRETPETFIEGHEYFSSDSNQFFPLKKEISFKCHNKSLSALSLDHSGARFVTGSHDYSIKFWDFNRLDINSPNPFRALEEPCGAYPIRSLLFAPKGGSDKFLAISASAQAKILSRDGSLVAEFVKGDQYLLDMRNTSGHVVAINAGVWHPTNHDWIATCSMDSTVRIWDINKPKKQIGIIVVRSKLPGTKSPVTSLVYSHDGKELYTASNDGSLKVWSSNLNHVYARPVAALENAHSCHNAITSLALSNDNRLLLSRSMDHTMKIWDRRKFNSVLHEWNDLPNLMEETSCLWSPDEQSILTGTSYDPDSICNNSSKDGTVVIYDAKTFELRHEISLPKTSATKLLWHNKLNQLLVCKSDGNLSVFYDDDLSLNGAKICRPSIILPSSLSSGKSLEDQRTDAAYIVAESRPHILVPNSLPLFQDEPSSLKRKRDKERRDPILSKLPELPVTGPGQGGRIGSNLTQHLMRHIVKDYTREEDPREALLKYAALAESDPRYIAPAYKDTQPNPILADTESDALEEEKEALKKRIL